ncbi:MAG TPA: asparagine synthase (glutamine-hydrolyzing) [Vicinamibacterales bacterium]|nr:asparagine synthase (glutamine-hydrolyzing) [Vicinamibacterales bacterium]
MRDLLQLIHHRGPDDTGVWRDQHWQLGMTRLAIMDPGHGNQPMISRNRAWVLVLNGEIYNFHDLRRELPQQGRLLRTNSDTEVLVELIAARGVAAALAAVDGMYAFAALCTTTGEVWLARDRFGEKPLFIDRREGAFAFCSELAPLLKMGRAPKRVDPAGLCSILRYGYPWPGLSAVAGISSLPPAHYLRRRADGSEHLTAYWNPPNAVDESAGSVEACGAKLLDLLDESVRRRLIADVPLGVFLSGGVDSAAVAASAVRQRRDLEAVTVGFDAAAYDERPLTRRTAAHLKIVLHEQLGNLRAFTPEAFDDLLLHHGQPFADTSAVPTRAVSKIARQRFKVVLSGDGGDELLAGYLAHSRNARLCRWAGGQVSGVIADTLQRCLPGRASFERVERTLELVASTGRGLLPHVMAGVFTDDSLLALVKGSGWERPARDQLEVAREDSRRIWNSVRDPHLALSLYQLRHSFPSDILTKVDRMSMAESLEVRAPFLEPRLAGYALSLPSHLKVRGVLGKFVLRHALRSRLPVEILGAPKRGFALPVKQWLGDAFWRELRVHVDDYLEEDTGELNGPALRHRVAVDATRCRHANDYRALHRCVLIYGFLRWRRILMDHSPIQVERAEGAA